MAEIASIQLTAKSKKYLRKLVKADKEKIFKSLERFFDGQALLTAGHISKNLLSGQLLNRRTGTLARSVTGRGVRVGGIPGMRVGIFRGPALAYAGLQEHGGTIRAKGKSLAIPIDGGPAVTSAGVERFGGPRNFPKKLVFIPFPRSKNPDVVGGLFVANSLKAKQGRDKRGRFSGLRQQGRNSLGQFTKKRKIKVSLRDAVLAYLLMRKVTIKPKHYLRDGVRSQLPLVAEDLAKFLALQFSNLTEEQKKKKAKQSGRRRSGGTRKRDASGRFI